jgi:hypothetical protein
MCGDFYGDGVWIRLFYILALFRKILTSAYFLERFQKMDPELGAMDRGAEV